VVRRINLLPQSERARTSTDLGLLALVALIIVAVFGMGLGYYLLHNNLGDRKQELADVQQQAASTESQVAALKQYDRLQSQRASVENVVQSIYANRTLVSNVLDAISLVVPESAWFESLQLSTSDPPATATGGNTPAAASKTDNALSIEGNTYSMEEVAQVLVRLQLVPGLTGVSLQSAGTARGTVDQSREVRGFSIEASVDNTQSDETPLPVSQVEVETP
jgi:Tfp pilus assembly protein PilN